VANLSLRLRLVALALSIATLAGVIIGAAAATEKQVATLRNHLTSVRNESFRIADKLESGILSLNATLLRFVLGRDPADWQRFSATENASKNILNLGYDLATAHRAANAQLVDESQKSLTVLQLVITRALALLLAAGVWIVTIFYRELIPPLQLMSIRL
jgi:H+/Cl- antiporter ClcA